MKRRKKCLLYYQLSSMVSCSVWIQLCCQSCVAVSSPVTCLHLSWWDLTVMQIITPCIATKLKVCYLLQMLFFVTFNSLVAKNVFVMLINCYFFGDVFGIFSFMQGFWYFERSRGPRNSGKSAKSREIGRFFHEFVPKNPVKYDFFFRDLSEALFMVEHFYNQTGKTVHTRNISGMLLCCKIKANWAWETKLQARILISFCGFVASWRALIFAVIGRNTINILEIF